MKKSKIAGIVGTVLLHGIVLLLLLLFTLDRPEEQEEGGVPVMLGDMEFAAGNSDPYMMTEVDVIPENAGLSEPEVSAADVEQPMITQTDEPSIQMKKEQPRKESSRKETSKTEPKDNTELVKNISQVPKEKTEAEKRAEAERAAAQAAASKVAGAFGKGTKMGSKGNADSGDGIQGSPTGNSDAGKTSGIGGIGTFDLNGRSLGPGGLPMPVYNVQDEGRVVVTIVVDPSGRVISTSINKRTNTVNAALRKAALDAASKARFNTISGVNNQSGTITYYFKLK